MKNNNGNFSGLLIAVAMCSMLAACGEPRAVMLPLQYPDGTAVTTTRGEPVMAGYQTYGTAMHANATALYATAAPASCSTCSQVATVVSEPSTFRQATGMLGVSTVGAGAVMGGLGMMTYGNAAEEGKLGTNVNNNSANNVSQNASQYSQNNASSRSFASSQSNASSSANAGYSGSPSWQGGGGRYAQNGWGGY